MVDEHTVIGKDLFKKETDISKFLGLAVTLALPAAAAAAAAGGEGPGAAGAAGAAGGGGVRGYIEGSFGSSGQYKVWAGAVVDCSYCCCFCRRRRCRCCCVVVIVVVSSKLFMSNHNFKIKITRTFARILSSYT